MNKRALLWFTRDLRIQDNAMIHWAAANSLEIIALAFEPAGRSFFQKEYYLRSAFEIELEFRKNKIPFYILKGKPEQEIPKWVQDNSIDVVLTQDSFNTRDRNSLARIENKLGSERVKTFFNQTLIDFAKLPFEVENLPNVFTQFRKSVEKSDCIGAVVSSELNSVTGFSPKIPNGADLLPLILNPTIESFPFDLKAGESGAQDQINEFFWQTNAIASYKETRNGMLAKDDSSKLSVGLGSGCISARTIYQEVKKFEDLHGPNESTEWFVFELLWRDYFKFLALKIGDKLFSRGGIAQKVKSWKSDPEAFNNWCNGETGADFIDANMIEIKKTGWMSNRGRQNVASYLAKTLQIDWTLGAQYFEDSLIDFDTESNWGNWLYVAGVGTDPRDRIFNYKRQAEMYDPDFAYRKTWLPTK